MHRVWLLAFILTIFAAAVLLRNGSASRRQRVAAYSDLAVWFGMMGLIWHVFGDVQGTTIALSLAFFRLAITDWGSASASRFR